MIWRKLPDIKLKKVFLLVSTLNAILILISVVLMSLEDSFYAPVSSHILFVVLNSYSFSHIIRIWLFFCYVPFSYFIYYRRENKNSIVIRLGRKLYPFGIAYFVIDALCYFVCLLCGADYCPTGIWAFLFNISVYAIAIANIVLWVKVDSGNENI